MSAAPVITWHPSGREPRDGLTLSLGLLAVDRIVEDDVEECGTVDVWADGLHSVDLADVLLTPTDLRRIADAIDAVLAGTWQATPPLPGLG